MKITFIRHGRSLANEYRELYKSKPTDISYIDSKLSTVGITEIVTRKHNIMRMVGIPNLILSSPFRRAIQTCLLFTGDIDVRTVICPHVKEFNEYNSVENCTIPPRELCRDMDICSLNKNKIDMTNYSQIVENKHEQICKFKDSLSHIYEKYIGDGGIIHPIQSELERHDLFSILVFTHQMFLCELLNITSVKNLEIIECLYDPHTQLFTIVENIINECKPKKLINNMCYMAL